MSNGPLANILMGAALLGTGLATTGADAQVINSGQPVVRDCDAASVGLRDLVVGDDGEGIRSFYSGQVVLLAIDQVEPAAAASGVVIMMDLRGSEMGERRCYALTGFTFLDVDKTKSAYDPQTGLRLTIPAFDYDTERGGIPGKPLVLRINLERASVTASR